MPGFQYSFMRFTGEHRAYTRLPLLIQNPTTKLSAIVFGLVDTGADATLFPATLAVRLGHKLKGKDVKTAVTGGIEQHPVVAYRHVFEVSLMTPDRRKIVWHDRMEIDCLESDPPLLLGVDDFLRHFKLTIDYPFKTMRLSW